MVMVRRDNDGNLIKAWPEKISPGSSIRGEAEAAWCAIRRAAAKGFNKIIIEGDAWNVIDPLQKSTVRCERKGSYHTSIPYFSLVFSLYSLDIQVTPEHQPNI